MKRLLGLCLVTLTLLAASASWASFHTFVVEQAYSNADTTVQFIVLHEAFGADDQEFLAGHAITTTGPGGSKVFIFMTNLPSNNTRGRRVLIATTGFAALGIVTPDYVVPNGFVPLTSGTIDYAGIPAAQMTYASLPTDGMNSLYRGGSVAPNAATNFAGVTASVQPPPPALNFQGIWWGAPAGSESGWGLNLAHQGDTIFASWFTYDPKGRGWWLVMTAQTTGTNTYQGQLFETSGPAFDAVPFLPGNVIASQIGTGTLTFSDASNGTFAYTVSKGGSVTQTKTLTRQVFGPMPTCTFGTQPNLALATNYQDLWWAKPAASESGWGINLNHQGDTIFATWFTYDHDGSPLWLVVTALKTSPGVYTGDLFQTTGPPFNSVPFNPANVVATKVGTATFTFTDGNNASFDYTVKLSDMANASHQTKAITREIFTSPGTVCQ